MWFLMAGLLILYQLHYWRTTVFFFYEDKCTCWYFWLLSLLSTTNYSILEKKNKIKWKCTLNGVLFNFIKPHFLHFPNLLTYFLFVKIFRYFFYLFWIFNFFFLNIILLDVIFSFWFWIVALLGPGLWKYLFQFFRGKLSDLIVSCITISYNLFKQNIYNQGEKLTRVS